MGYDKYIEDLPQYVRGHLEPAHAKAIEAAAKSDARLRAAIEAERNLERILDQYETPVPPAGLEGRFWRRFHSDKVAGRRNWLLKLAGPLAAGVLIAVGLIIFVNRDVDPAPEITAEQDAETDTDTDAPEIEVTWGESEVEYIVGGGTERPAMDQASLELLKALDNAAFLPLDELERPEDLLVLDEFELLRALSEDE